MTQAPDLPAPADYPAWLQETTADDLDTVRRLVAELKAAPPAAPDSPESPEGSASPDAAHILALWNQVETRLGLASRRTSLFGEVLPDAAARELADDLEQQVSRLDTDLSLDPELYAVLQRLDRAGLDDQALRYLDRLERDCRRSGVTADEPTRDRLRALNEELTALTQEFGRTIREDVRTVRVSPEQLDGLPADWIEAHPPDEDGLVTVSTDYPDSIPFRTFARDAAARRALATTCLQVGWPHNDQVLQTLFARRAEYAALLGYDSWADFNAETKMIGSGAAIATFIDKITDAASEAAVRDKQVLVERKQVDLPGAGDIDSSEVMFYAEAVRRERFEVDAQQVRQYFHEPGVRQGLLEVTGRLFGLHYEALEGPVWHESVHAYQARDVASGELVGRLYLDLYPRDGKFKHAAHFGLVPGLETDGGRQVPTGVLVCNLPAGLMEHSQVVTLFHEFGHLVHHLLGGRQHWVRFSGVATEWDFVEAPSQLLEEWAWDPAILATFARNEAGEPIPADLVARMRAGSEFGKGYQARTQMFYAALAYALHTERPDDISARTAELQRQYSVFEPLADSHLACSFGHLAGYSTAYYTYMWSLVIAKDLFSAFDAADLFDDEIADRYRRTILAPGGSQDAALLVRDFLGRDYTFDAYQEWLERPPGA